MQDWNYFLNKKNMKNVLKPSQSFKGTISQVYSVRLTDINKLFTLFRHMYS